MFLAPQSCAPASFRLGRDGACTRTRLLLCGPEAELPGSLPHSLPPGIHIVGGVARSLDRTTRSATPSTTLLYDQKDPPAFYYRAFVDFA